MTFVFKGHKGNARVPLCNLADNSFVPDSTPQAFFSSVIKGLFFKDADASVAATDSMLHHVDQNTHTSQKMPSPSKSQAKPPCNFARTTARTQSGRGAAAAPVAQGDVQAQLARLRLKPIASRGQGNATGKQPVSSSDAHAQPDGGAAAEPMENSTTVFEDLPHHLQSLIFALGSAPLTTCKAAATAASDLHLRTT